MKRSRTMEGRPQEFRRTSISSRRPFRTRAFYISRFFKHNTSAMVNRLGCEINEVCEKYSSETVKRGSSTKYIFADGSSIIVRSKSWEVQ